MISIEVLSLIGTLAIAAFGGFTFVRSGGWNAIANAQKSSEAMAALAQGLTALTDKVNSLPNAATISAHDQRLKAVEERVRDLPTAKQLGDLQASIAVLKAEVSGRLDTIAAEMRGADLARLGLSKQVERIEQHLLDQKHGG